MNNSGWNLLGFELSGTGGGFEAYIKTDEKRNLSYVITASDDGCAAPDQFPVMLGFHDRNEPHNGYQFDYIEYPETYSEVINAINTFQVIFDTSKDLLKYS